VSTVLVLILIVIAIETHASTVILKKGTRITGEVVGETSHAVRLQTSLGILLLQRDEILRIDSANPASLSPTMLRFQKALAANSLGAALAEIKEPSSLLASEWEQADQQLLEALGTLVNGSPDALSLISEPLGDFLLMHPRPPSPALVRRAIDIASRSADTTTCLRLLGRASRGGTWEPVELDPGLCQFLENEFESGTANELSKEWLNFFETRFRQHLKQDGVNPCEKNLLSRIFVRWILHCSPIATSSNAPEVWRPFSDYFANLPTEEAYQLLRLSVDEARRQGTTETMCRVFEKVEVLAHTRRQEIDMKPFLMDHTRLLLESHSFAEAKALLATWEAAYPDLTAELLLVTEFFERKAALLPNDLVQRYQLAKWALHMGLPEYAREEFQRLSYAPSVSQAARLQLIAMKTNADAENLSTAIAMVRQGRYAAARELIENLLKTNQPTHLTTESKLLLSLTQRYADVAPEAAQAQAISLIQQAERAALRREYPRAAELLREARGCQANRAIENAIRELHQRFPEIAAAEK
jgi:hypothetical protein